MAAALLFLLLAGAWLDPNEWRWLEEGSSQAKTALTREKRFWPRMLGPPDDLLARLASAPKHVIALDGGGGGGEGGGDESSSKSLPLLLHAAKIPFPRPFTLITSSSLQ